MNITEDYVSFEVAKLLKEKGFNEECEYFYDEYKDEDKHVVCSNGCSAYNDDKHPTYYSMPTHQMALAWLREKHNICITIYPDKENGYEAVLYDIENDVEIVLESFGVYGIHIYEEIYEEAVEAALKYSLKNLI